MSSRLDEVCENCIYWIGDGSGMEGECTHDEGHAGDAIGRYESCVHMLGRDIDESSEGGMGDKWGVHDGLD